MIIEYYYFQKEVVFLETILKRSEKSKDPKRSLHKNIKVD